MDESLSQDLVALWQSELTAMAADREAREAFVSLVAAWAALTASPHDSAPGSARSAQPPGAAALAAASGAGGDADDLLLRITELERRLARLEGRGG